MSRRATRCSAKGRTVLPLKADALPIKEEQTLIGAAEMSIGQRCWMYMCSAYKGRASSYKGRASA
jgi:hypothetical protein